MSGPSIGSLFSGYGGLEQGVQSVLGGQAVWHSEIDPGACKILAHRYPDVPNLGDITAVDWTAVEPVDVLTGGFPCQDVSCAGLRKGLRPDTRSGLWTQMAYAIDQLRPSLVVIENVRGLLSAEAHSDLEPCPWCVGDGGGVPLRALGAVLGDLADIGYDASWQGLRAADVGAPHGRFRVFVTAWPVAANAHHDATRPGCEPRHAAGRRAEPAQHRGSAQDPDVAARGERRLAAPGQAEARRPRANAGGRDRAPAADAESDGRHERWAESARLVGRSDDAFGGASAEWCGTCGDPTDHHDAGGFCAGLCGGSCADPLLGRPTLADADSDGLGWLEEPHGVPQAGRRTVVERHDADGLAVAAGRVDWGAYTAAVRRWEQLTRPAPNPTERGKNGQPRLSPAFVEWMQGLPAGWVTDVPGLTRNEQLKALGNGVVPQQAAQALRMLLPDVQAVAA